MVGQTLAQYEILQMIGRGGMGEVYLARDTRLERRVALKFLPPDLEQNDTARRRFLREAKSAAALDHPYICHIHEIAESRGRSFIAMEFVEGQTLKNKLELGPVPLQEALVILAESAEALEKAHQKSIVHRDLKPANIMLTAEGHAKIMDFGLSKRVAAGQPAGQETGYSELTGSGMAVGTVPYMSPEQLRGEEIDARSDIFSLGIVAYEMLAGAHPFLRANAVETAHAILNDDPRPLARYATGIPLAVDRMLIRMLAKNAGRRCQSMGEVRSLLKAPARVPLQDAHADPGLLEQVFGRLVSTNPRRWWELNHLLTLFVYPLAGFIGWIARDWLAGSWPAALLLALFVAIVLLATISVILRGYLLITSAFNPLQLPAEVRRWSRALAICGVLVWLLLAGIAVLAIPDHPTTGVLLLAFSVGALMATAVAEPNIDRAAFPEPLS